jgi:LacI family transcriptional regulator
MSETRDPPRTRKRPSSGGDRPELGALVVKPGRRPTMTDVARLAGVSQSSVSLVLNDISGARISDATRQRVLEVARQVGYALPGARHLARSMPGRTTIAYLVDEISTSPHPVVTLDGARDAGWEMGFLVAAHVTRSNPELEAATIAQIRQDPSVLGVIYSTIFTREVNPPEGLADVPTILLNCYTRDRRFPSVVPGEVSGSFAAASHLVARGHRRIGFVNGEPWMDAAADRLRGFRQALATADIALDPALMRNGDWLPLSGYQLTLELLASDEPPSAIFCANDLMAMGALEAVIEQGLDVPADVSVLGYDDQELARYTHPPLSSLVLPNYEMGRRATEMLIDAAIHGKKPAARHVKIDGPLVERASVTAPSEAGRRNRLRAAAVLRERRRA